MRAVLPGADRFSEKSGDPPVIRGYSVDDDGRETLLGYVFLTSEVPPETFGYDAPIEVLVGMDPEGVLTGARVVDYRESLRRTRGDFLTRPGVQGQFAGKPITDAFRVRQDVQNITGATITVAAMALGIRNASRRVWAAYLRQPDPAVASGPPPRIGTLDLEVLEGLTWAEFLHLDLAIEIGAGGAEASSPRVSVALAYLRDREVGELIMGGNRYGEALERAPEGVGERHRFLIGLNGVDAVLFRPESLAFVQDGEVLPVPDDGFVGTANFTEGKAQGQFRRVGLLLIDPSLDVERPFEVVVPVPGDEGSEVRATYEPFAPPPPPPVVAEGPSEPSNPASPEGAGATGTDPAVGGELPAEVETGSDVAVEGTVPPPAEPVDETAAVGAGSSPPVAGPAVPAGGSGDVRAMDDLSDDELMALLFEEEELAESQFARTLSQTSWLRVGFLLLLLSGALAAFLTRSAGMRWAVLGGTLMFLGFIDRGFLSVSHILAGISVGTGVYLNDLSLLILVVFTVATTLFVGRVFCGFLCPFGAIQDALERIVPRRFQRELPRVLHERALLIKYLILGVVLVPAVMGIPVAIFHFFEPFGTVFFWSPSPLLWFIAVGILAASAVVPRFYCRYACPLGAALAIGSLLAPFRIRRVDQCSMCTVCERKCPTGAIRREAVNFKECVRCGICENLLEEKAGVCRHDIAEVRSRLVRIRTPEAGVSR